MPMPSDTDINTLLGDLYVGCQILADGVSLLSVSIGRDDTLLASGVIRVPYVGSGRFVICDGVTQYIVNQVNQNSDWFDYRLVQRNPYAYGVEVRDRTEDDDTDTIASRFADETGDEILRLAN